MQLPQRDELLRTLLLRQIQQDLQMGYQERTLRNEGH
jgi:hypothetical protein